MATGTVKTYLEARGFGFLKPSDGGEDIFFHATSLLGSGINPDDLRKGDLLAYEIGRGRDGRTAAENVRWAE
jgi:cold shock protein